MDLERQNTSPPSSGVPFAAKVAIGALVVWAGLSLLQWFIASALSFARFGLIVVIVVALFGWAVSSKGNR